MKNIIKRISLSLAVLLSFATIAVPLPASAALFDDAKNQVCEGLGAGGAATSCDGSADSRVTSVIRVALNLLSVVAGIITVIMIIIAGLKYITSQGDSNSISAAKNTLLYAIIGLVIVLLSQIIVKFVLDRTTTPACPAGQTLQTDGTCS